MNTKLRIIVTGATGMVGEGVLHECLLHDAVDEVLVIGRKTCAVSHPKLKEIIHTDFYDFSSIANQLSGYDACFFCLGVSSVGMKEAEYYRLTYTLTMHVAAILSQQNAGMTFCYVSGAHTDSTEKGNIMWARVKGKTENALGKLPFKQVYNFRPGIIKPTKGLKNTLGFYRYLGWLIPLIQIFTTVVSLKQVGLAMINAAVKGYEKTILEAKDIVELSKR